MWQRVDASTVCARFYLTEIAIHSFLCVCVYARVVVMSMEMREGGGVYGYLLPYICINTKCHHALSVSFSLSHTVLINPPQSKTNNSHTHSKHAYMSVRIYP